MAHWGFILADSTGEVADLTDVRNRSVSFRLHEPDEARFTIDGRDPHAALIVPLVTDLVVYRHDVKVFHGRIGHVTRTLSPDAHSLAVVAHSYRALLERRLILDDATLTFTGADQADIAWTLISESQNRPGGYLGIWRDAPDTGVTRDRTYEPGKTVLEAVDQLSQVQGGFEWRISPERAFHVGYPQLGTVRPGVHLEFPGNLSAVTETYTPGEYANVVRVTGDPDATVAETRTQSDVAGLPEGRWEKPISAGYDITQQATVAERADWYAAEHGEIRAGFNVTVQQGVWGGPNEWFRGDTVKLQVKTSEDADATVVADRLVRVMDVDVSLSDDDDAETVSAHLDRPGVRNDYGTVELGRRVATLERKQ